MNPSQSLALSSQDPASTIFCFRAHLPTQLLIDNYLKFVDTFGDQRVFVLADETAVTVEWPAGMQVVKITSNFLDEKGLYHNFDKVGWRCGDYFYYAALHHFQFSKLWLIEADVYFDYPSLTDFFDPFEASQTDFISHRVGHRNVDWYWHRSMADLGYAEVYGSLFPLTRVTHESLQILQRERQRISSGFISGETSDYLYPNDEAFTASVLIRSGYTTQSLTDIHPRAFSLFQYSNKYRIPDALSAAPSPKVIHSALIGQEYLSYVESRIYRQLVSDKSIEATIKSVYANTDTSNQLDVTEAILDAFRKYLGEIGS